MRHLQILPETSTSYSQLVARVQSRRRRPLISSGITELVAVGRGEVVEHSGAARAWEEVSFCRDTATAPNLAYHMGTPWG